MADDDKEGKDVEGTGTPPPPAEEAPEETARLIMRAAGIKPEEVPPSQTPEEHLQRFQDDCNAMINDVRKACGMAQQSVQQANQSIERAEKIVQRVESFCQTKLPQLILAAVDRAAEQGVGACLSGLKREVDSFSDTLREVQRSGKIVLVGARDVNLFQPDGGRHRRRLGLLLPQAGRAGGKAL